MEYTGLQPPNENIKSLLEKVIQREGFKNCRINIEPLGAKGDNYLGVLMSVRVNGFKNHKEDNLHLVIKTGLDDELLRQKTQTVLTFVSEKIMYEEILPVYKAIQDTANISDGRRFKFAKCYEADTTLREECIILEDLRARGFAMEDRLKPLSYSHAKMVVETLSKYHALSFVFRDKYEDKYKSVIRKIPDFYGAAAKFDGFTQYVEHAIERATLTVGEDEKNKFVKAAKKGIEMLKLGHKPWDEHGCVITHHDSWINNVLFQNKNGPVNDAILLDFQMIKHMSPAIDFLYFVFLSTDSQFRAEHYEDLKNVYYDTMQSFMKDLGYDVARFYTRDDMERNILDNAPYTLALSCMILLLISVETEDVTEIDDNISDLKGKSAKNYERRMSGTIRDYIKYRLIV